MEVAVPIAFWTTEHPGAAVALCPIELEEISSAETSIAARLPEGTVAADLFDSYRAWNGRLWHKSFRAAPESRYGAVDKSTITRTRLRHTEQRTIVGIDEFRTSKAAGINTPSYLSRAIDGGVRHAFTSRFQRTHGLSLIRKEQAVPEDRMIEGQQRAMDEAVRLAAQSVLIDDELWISSLGPLVEIDYRGWAGVASARLMRRNEMPRPGFAVSAVEFDGMVERLGIAGIMVDIDHDSSEVLEYLEYDRQSLALGDVDGYNATGLAWDVFRMLSHIEAGRIVPDALRHYISLRSTIEEHAKRCGIPLQPDRMLPYETSQTDYPNADAIWSIVQDLRPHLNGPTKSNGVSLGKLDVLRTIDLTLALRAPDLACFGS